MPTLWGHVGGGGNVLYNVAATASTDLQWQAWTTATASAVDRIFLRWTVQVADDFIRQQAPVVGEPRRQTEAELQAERERITNRHRELAESAERAEALLTECLSPNQRKQYDKHRFFHVKAASGSIYRIMHGITGNVSVVRPGKGQHRGSYCVHPYDVPVGDVMLAQKFWLEHDEEEFKRVANFTPSRELPVPV